MKLDGRKLYLLEINCFIKFLKTMKKLSSILMCTAFVVALSIFPSYESVSQSDGCNGCWWNDVDQECCENGSMCCAGGCGGGSQDQ